LAAETVSGQWDIKKKEGGRQSIVAKALTGKERYLKDKWKQKKYKYQRKRLVENEVEAVGSRSSSVYGKTFRFS
jgi:hypothetical protein